MRRTAAEAAETRRRILDAATLALADRGWDGATFEHIAGRIGMARGAVHHHFRGGKSELLATVLTEQWSRYGVIVLAPLRDRTESPVDRLEAFLTGYLGLLVDDPLFRALATVTTLVAPMARSTGDPGLEEHRESLDGWRSALRPVLAELHDGPADAAIDAAVFAIINLAVGANATAAIEPDRLPRTPAERHAVAAVVLSGVTARRHTPVDADLSRSPR